jgi:hypothetical protein
MNEHFRAACSGCNFKNQKLRLRATGAVTVSG